MACNRRAVNARELGPGISVFSRIVISNATLSIVIPPAPACRGSAAEGSIPPNRCFIQIYIDLLGLEVLIDAVDPQFPAEARLLKASPWRFHARRLHVIHPHNACADSLNHAHGTIDIARPDGGGQPEGSVVCNFERLAFVVEWNHASHRPEDLFPGNPRRVVHIVKD